MLENINHAWGKKKMCFALPGLLMLLDFINYKNHDLIKKQQMWGQCDKAVYEMVVLTIFNSFHMTVTAFILTVI